MSKIIYCDIDGVLTDGKIWISQTGEISKGFNTRDIRAIRELIANGYEVNLVTASSWPGIHSFIEKTGAYVIVEREKAKIETKGCIVVADDAWDLAMVRKAKKAYAPKNCDICVKAVPGIKVLKTKGGQGVIAELLTELVK